ncbi:DUF4862 family protein [Actinotignum urinale]|uniref:DUF4862 family protein n=1 Tax=Actinotignum urinale TaxID=190146 RepID=A0AAW9HWM5_9ACTO|nr:DUF4862 family protein [Actinotignum urinale]MDY5129010.1 DUF4862 family protein [Actinotignum urinale]MDY5132435.1 DUF4862 family protein [Actinotignum urinale]MDY5152408.1 DUF4862 family protein [Actinotignum urinale]MDY5154810.1 DUF4862 family protein [Actinotignum urinale]
MVDTPFVVGAYASLPEGKPAQEKYYTALAATPWINGIEIPFPGDLAQDAEWLAAQLPAHWDANTITLIPGTMQNMGKNPAFGLASPVEEGRHTALAFLENVRLTVHKLADIKGSPVIRHIQVHSAPRNVAEAQAFKTSLTELSAQDWCGAKIVIEHCDAPRENQQPEKGFLEIDDEIAIAQQLGLGIHINWGRSCLEERSVDAPYSHIEKAGTAGVLAGLLFSGAGPDETQYGYSWIDGHLPAKEDEPTSLLTDTEINRCAHLAREFSASYIGAKICVPQDASIEERIGMLHTIYAVATR